VVDDRPASTEAEAPGSSLPARRLLGLRAHGSEKLDERRPRSLQARHEGLVPARRGRRSIPVTPPGGDVERVVRAAQALEESQACPGGYKFCYHEAEPAVRKELTLALAALARPAPALVESPPGVDAREAKMRVAGEIVETVIRTMNGLVPASAVTGKDWSSIVEWKRAEALRLVSAALNDVGASDRDGQCRFAGPWRGDCEHFIGVPGSLNEQTTDVYGKPHRWCWHCWLMYQLRQFREAPAPSRESEGERVRAALEFYADPATYFAIGFVPDPPCGGFMDDFSDTELGRKPGKLARETLDLSAPPPADSREG
jgi:hypothetical protein